MTDNSAGPAKALFDAIYEGDAATVELLLNTHPELLTAMDWYYHHTPLHHAAYWNKREITELLLARGADVNVRDPRGRTPLHVRSVHRTPEVVELLLARGAEVNAKDIFGATPIFSAASKRVAELLVAHGANLDVYLPATLAARHRCGFRKGWTPLHAAAHHGDADLAEYLLSKGCDVNARTSDSDTPLRWALGSRETIEVVAVLLDHGAKVNLKDHLGKTVLYWAIRNGEQEMVELLLARGAKLLERDESTPLHLAASAHQTGVAEYLIQQGADVNVVDRSGNTPLLDSVSPCDLGPESGAQEMLELLLANGADVNAKDNDGLASLHLALTKQAWPLVNLLLANGAAADIFAVAAIGEINRIRETLESHSQAVHQADATGQTMLHWAAITGKVEAVEMLLSHKAAVNAKDRYGNTALHIAAVNDHGEVAQLLLDRGADIEALDEEGSTPFIIAAWMSREVLMVLLAKRGANINRQDTEGWTALHMAVRHWNAATVAALLNLHVEINLVNKKGRTALDVAIFERQKDIAEQLRQHGAKRARQLR